MLMPSPVSMRCHPHVARSSIITMGAIESAAETCLQAECDVGTIDDLLVELKGEVSTLDKRTKDLLTTIGHLEALNKTPCVDKKEIETIVKMASQSKFVSYDGDENSYG